MRRRDIGLKNTEAPVTFSLQVCALHGMLRLRKAQEDVGAATFHLLQIKGQVTSAHVAKDIFAAGSFDQVMHER